MSKKNSIFFNVFIFHNFFYFCYCFYVFLSRNLFFVRYFIVFWRRYFLLKCSNYLYFLKKIIINKRIQFCNYALIFRNLFCFIVLLSRRHVWRNHIVNVALNFFENNQTKIIVLIQKIYVALIAQTKTNFANQYVNLFCDNYQKN